MDGRNSSFDHVQYIQSLRQEIDRTLGEVADAVNAAPDGAWINGSEQQVCDLMNRLKKAAFEKALQMRIDAGEASFSPCARRVRQDPRKQGATPDHPPDPQPPDRTEPHLLSRVRRRRQRSDR